MEHCVRFAADGTQNVQQALAGLARDYALCREPQETTRLTIYDTFDWRLYQRKLALYAEGTSLALYPLSGKGALVRGSMASGLSFASDLPDGLLKDELAPITAIRALLPVASARLRITPFRILDSRQKTVAFLSLHEAWSLEAPDTRLAAQWWLVGLKGYRQQLKELAEALDQAGWQPGPRDVVYEAVVAAAGQVAGSYSDDLSIDLSPTMRSDEAAKIILCQLLDVMKANEPYIQQDVDVEFLHDYRVAIRRTRSVLGQLKEVFPASAVGHFREEFSAVAQRSNQLRDLDVYLLREPAYRALLPHGLVEFIDPLFDYLRAQRADAFAAMVAGLQSSQQRQLMEEWEAFLSQTPSADPPPQNASRPIIDLARQRLKKRYNAIVALGREIGPEADDSALHRLRIECKKLRYLLEFFSSLFPAKKVDPLVSQLKALQGILGSINDLRVQEEYLQRVAQALPVEGAEGRATLLAIGVLVGKLDDEKRAVKGQFAAAFEDFASPATARAFRRLFGAKRSTG